MPIYLDNHATTRVDPRVIDAMLPWLGEKYGNASSVGHPFGEEAHEAVEGARATIASAIGAVPTEIVFTSGATESNNLAIRGVAERPRRRGDHLVSVTTEHPSVLGPLERLGQRGFQIDRVDVEPHGSPRAGRLDVDRFADALSESTCLASVMLANNEIGVVQPVAEVSACCRRQGVLLHCDATQGIGKVQVEVDRLGVDLMSFSAHKLHGPKGVGALYVRRRNPGVRLEAQIVGGGHEGGRRSGTLNVPGIVGFARAVELAVAEREHGAAQMTALRNDLFGRLRAGITSIEVLGPGLNEVDAQGNPLRLPNNLDVQLGKIDGEAVRLHAPEVAASSGAACSSVDPEPSHVLRALGLSADAARCSLRFGLSRFTTQEEIAEGAEAVVAAVAAVNELAS